jgi:hypothetical protein
LTLRECGFRDERTARGGHLRHGEPDHPRDLQDPLVGQARLAQSGDALGGLDVVVGEGGLVAPGVGQAQREPVAAQKVLGRPSALGDLGRRVAAAIAFQHTLHGQEREPVVLHRASEILERHAVRGQLLEELAAGLTGLAARPLQQALALEVDRHRRDSSRARRRPT